MHTQIVEYRYRHSYTTRGSASRVLLSRLAHSQCYIQYVLGQNPEEFIILIDFLDEQKLYKSLFDQLFLNNIYFLKTLSLVRILTKIIFDRKQ